MPVIAHIMIALVYITASVLGAVVLYQQYEFEAVTAALVGAASGLAAISPDRRKATLLQEGARSLRPPSFGWRLPGRACRLPIALQSRVRENG